MKFADNFNEILSAFATTGVEFLVVGGYAVNFYGYDRTTSDLDIWINPIESNKQKITLALSRLGYMSEGGPDIFLMDFSAPSCFRLGEGIHLVDVFTHVVGVNFQEAWAARILFQSEETMNIYFISLHHLIVNKMLTGREKDKMDVETLQKIIEMKK